MLEQIQEFIEKVKAREIDFREVINFIETHYMYRPTAFKNGHLHNDASQNQGSAKVFAFAQLNQLSQADTLYLFAEHYQAVLHHPDGNDHQNIRQFMQHGWNRLHIEGQALHQK